MKTPSLREQRLIAILILIAVVAIIWLGMVQPMIDGFAERRAERAQLLAQHQRNQQMAASLPLLRAAARRQREDAARFALPAASVDAAQDGLRDLVGRIAARNNIVIKKSQSETSRPGWSSLRINGVLRLDQLARFMADIQNEQPLILIESTSIAANAALQSGVAAPMEVQLEISAPFDASAIR